MILYDEACLPRNQIGIVLGATVSLTAMVAIGNGAAHGVMD